MKALLHTLNDVTPIAIDIPEAHWFQHNALALNIYSNIHETVWEALLGYSDTGLPITRAVTKSQPDTANTLRELRTLCEA
jgi:hypothetical protein